MKSIIIGWAENAATCQLQDLEEDGPNRRAGK